jgi:hypothetical protein
MGPAAGSGPAAKGHQLFGEAECGWVGPGRGVGLAGRIGQAGQPGRILLHQTVDLEPVRPSPISTGYIFD